MVTVAVLVILMLKGNAALEHSWTSMENAAMAIWIHVVFAAEMPVSPMPLVAAARCVSQLHAL